MSVSQNFSGFYFFCCIQTWSLFSLAAKWHPGVFIPRPKSLKKGEEFACLQNFFTKFCTGFHTKETKKIQPVRFRIRRCRKRARPKNKNLHPARRVGFLGMRGLRFGSLVVSVDGVFLNDGSELRLVVFILWFMEIYEHPRSVQCARRPASWMQGRL